MEESKVKTAILSVEYKDHEVIVLTNRNGDTYTSKSEELMDFLFSCDDQSHITKLEARNKELEESLGFRETWPITDVLLKLVEST